MKTLEKLRRHIFEKGKSVTGFDALRFNSSGSAFARRIKDLEELTGKAIKRDRVPYKRQDGRLVYITKYSFQSKKRR